ncbi:hypothetical protein [Stratiformator vulcanicus]|uniref:Uncharacterized protein n=1 Tax=Stratiformator vulcanicus TaxID=2527980 RepID=A0A517QYF2_9PLAN|nr:hypothetical protein [Stratiformator vulcanicus]QDT36624.1 hypothetical protein Pan189_09840 [Stratiformator vulcanicus]
MRFLTGAVVVLLMVLTTLAQASPFSVVGSFDVVGGQRDGEDLPKAEWEGLTVIFTKDTVVTVKDDNKLYAAKYRIVGASSKIPGALMIDMTSTIPKPGQKARGLIEIEQKSGIAKLIYALPGTGRPDDFEPGKGELMFELKPLAEPVSVE